MGQKVHPYGFRLGVIREAKSKWFAEGPRYRDQLIEDIKIRRYILDVQRTAAISDVIIERAADAVTVTISTAKPGIIIGKGGRDVDVMRQKIEKMTGRKVRVNVEETKDPDLNAQLVADNIARQIERRVSYRRAMRQAVDRSMRLGAGGIRCAVSGRLGGAEIARSESVGPEGRVPLHTLRADVEYGRAEAKTGYGHIGVKVWIYRGDILPPKKETQPQGAPEAAVAEVAEEAAVAAAPVVEAPAPTVPAVPQMDAAPAQTEVIEMASPEEDELLSALGGSEEDAAAAPAADAEASEEE
jgi:small subunit ribosomal protein S3